MIDKLCDILVNGSERSIIKFRFYATISCVIFQWIVPTTQIKSVIFRAVIDRLRDTQVNCSEIATQVLNWKVFLASLELQKQ